MSLPSAVPPDSGAREPNLSSQVPGSVSVTEPAAGAARLGLPGHSAAAPSCW